MLSLEEDAVIAAMLFAIYISFNSKLISN